MYLQKKFGECLKNVTFVKNNTQIKFVMEDKYLRVALNAKLRANGLFADTSFNTDIVTLDESVLVRVVQLLIPNDQAEVVLQHLGEFNIEAGAVQGDKDRAISSIIRRAFETALANGFLWIAELLMAI